MMFYSKTKDLSTRDEVSGKTEICKFEMGAAEGPAGQQHACVCVDHVDMGQD